MPMPSSIPPRDRGDDLVLDTIRAHAPALLAVARRHSLCADDAQDAYQRALEIFLRRAASLDPEGAHLWLRTVVKHEAMAVRATRQKLVGAVEVDLDAHEARDLPDADERIASFDRLTRAGEALQRLKPQELEALVLKARGYSYHEICEITGWTYTKVNRCLTEGRRAFLDRYATIEAGRECARWRPLLSALADGEASAEEVLELRPHLRNCAACRTALGEYRTAPRRVAAVVPLGALGALSAGGPHTRGGGFLLRAYEALTGGVHERAIASAQKLQVGLEVASTGKLAAVAASATAIAGGGVAAVGDHLDGRRPDGVAAVNRAAAVVRPHRVEPEKRSPQALVTTPARREPRAAAIPASPAPAHEARRPEVSRAREFGFEAAGHPRAPTPAPARGHVAQASSSPPPGPSAPPPAASSSGAEFGP